MMRRAAMFRFTGHLSCAVMFVLTASVFAAVLSGDEPVSNEQSSKEQPAKAAAGEEFSDSEDVRSFAPVETDPDPLPGFRLPVDVRTGGSPFLSDGFHRQVALWILLAFASMLLLHLMFWRKRPEPEAAETAPPTDALSYEEVLAAAAERERVKQMSQRR